MVWRSLPDIAFSDAKQLLVGCREELEKKDTEFDSKVSHSFCKMKLKKYCFFKVFFLNIFWGKLGLNSWLFYLRTVKSCLSKAGPSLRFFALEIRKTEVYKKQTGSNVCFLLNKVYVLEHDRFYTLPAGNYTFKVNNRNTRLRCEISSKLTKCLYC